MQERAETGKVPSKAISGISAAFQQMAGKIVDFPWDAATGACSLYNMLMKTSCSAYCQGLQMSKT